MNRWLVSICLSGWVIVLPSCEKLDEPLVLDQHYLQVADVLEYCQGPCQQTLDWENHPVRVTGSITDIENDSVFQQYKDNARFYLTDIRNGMFIEIRVDGDADAVFQFLSGIVKKDRVYIRGITESIIANQGSECMKGVVVILEEVTNINVNL